MNGRSVAEWFGETNDTAIPPRVRVRVFARAAGCCQICTRKIASGERWVADHIIAIINGGANRESNLQLCCDWCDRKVKTPADVAEKALMYRKFARFIGATRPKSRPIPGSKASGLKKTFSGQVSRRRT